MEFDDEWINDYEMTLKKPTPRIIKIFYCYVDSENTLHKINQELFEVTNNLIKRDQLIKLIISNKKKHELLNILSYFTTNTDITNKLGAYHIEDIRLPSTHRAFETMNSLFFIFKANSKKLITKGTRKVLIASSRNTRRKPLKATDTEL